jgi:hypothetical protein
MGLFVGVRTVKLVMGELGGAPGGSRTRTDLVEQRAVD